MYTHTHSGLHSYLLDKPQTGVSFEYIYIERERERERVNTLSRIGCTFTFFFPLSLFLQGNRVDLHGKVLRYVDYDPDQQDPVYTGPLQVLGPGFAPFKPYVRPKHFYTRVSPLQLTLLPPQVSRLYVVQPWHCLLQTNA